MTADARLFGRPGAEELHHDIASVYESHIEPCADPQSDRSYRIEEWSVRGPADHVPPVDALLDWACEWQGDNGELDEDGGVAFSDAAERSDVKAAFQAAIDLWASKVSYRMAAEHLRTYTVTWDDNGEPLIDGEPLYQPAAPEVAPDA